MFVVGFVIDIIHAYYTLYQLKISVKVFFSRVALQELQAGMVEGKDRKQWMLEYADEYRRITSSLIF